VIVVIVVVLQGEGCVRSCRKGSWDVVRQFTPTEQLFQQLCFDRKRHTNDGLSAGLDCVECLVSVHDLVVDDGPPVRVYVENHTFLDEMGQSKGLIKRSHYGRIGLGERRVTRRM
jgi:hypothetical protein